MRVAGEGAWLRVAEKMAMRYISRGGKGKGRMCEMSVIGMLRCVEVVGGDWGWVPCDDSYAVFLGRLD